jgi:hypothetical protein
VQAVLVDNKVTEPKALTQYLAASPQSEVALVHEVTTQEAPLAVLVVRVVAVVLVLEAHSLELEQLVKDLLAVLVATTRLLTVRVVEVVLAVLEETLLAKTQVALVDLG